MPKNSQQDSLDALWTLVREQQREIEHLRCANAGTSPDQKTGESGHPEAASLSRAGMLKAAAYGIAGIGAAGAALGTEMSTAAAAARPAAEQKFKSRSDGPTLTVINSGTGPAVNASANGVVGAKVTNSSSKPAATAVLGVIAGSSPAELSSGVYGINQGSGTGGMGVWGTHTGKGTGVCGDSSGGSGGHFTGPVSGVTGNCTGNGGSGGQFNGGNSGPGVVSNGGSGTSGGGNGGTGLVASGGQGNAGGNGGTGLVTSGGPSSGGNAGPGLVTNGGTSTGNGGSGSPGLVANGGSGSSSGGGNGGTGVVANAGPGNGGSGVLSTAPGNGGTGVVGKGTGQGGTGGNFTGAQYGVVGNAPTNTGSGPQTNYAVLAKGDFGATGTKSAIVPFADGAYRKFYCLESPECWFEDFGSARLRSGRSRVSLDPKFAHSVRTDDYHVFLTPLSDSNGLYVADRSGKGFTVIEQGGGKSDTPFSYRIVALRKDVNAPRLQVTKLS